MGKRKTRTGALSAVALLAVAGCSGGGVPSGETAAAPADPGDASGEIKVLTHRTDLVRNGTMKAYAAEFNKTHPEVRVRFEALTDYEGEVRIRMNTKAYGDVLMIPAAVAKDDYPTFFAPLGATSELSRRYRFSDKTDVGGKVYGIAQFGTANGFVYNRSVWRRAGVTEWPATPERFIAALKAVKDRTGAVPYYTNFKDAWPLSSPWTNSVGSVTCDAKATDKLAGPVSPWRRGGELHVIDSLLHDIVRERLAEKDPTTTNWESSKTLMARGEIGTMLLGSWAVAQMRDAARRAGTDPDDIGFMPFPVREGGTFCATLVSDYQQAVNVHSGNKAAARAWIDWFTEKSGYAEKEGAVSAVRSAALPSTLKDYVDNDVILLERSEAETARVNAIDNAAEIGLAEPDYRQKLIDLARGAQRGGLRDFFADLDRRWDEAARTAGS
ncbi:ABC transporter substrate-binding protein [Streptomyces sp. HMX112]|uniref:ABC transporter substrate-binding protein n=1 Tax=Streptomyces sp. HMX112 TaxID=3390850 RepID=UPI003A80D379